MIRGSCPACTLQCSTMISQLSSLYNAVLNRDQRQLSSLYTAVLNCDQRKLSSLYTAVLNRDQRQLSSLYTAVLNCDQRQLSSLYNAVLNHDQMQLSSLYKVVLKRKATKILNDPDHPLNSAFEMLLSGRHSKVPLTKKNIRKKSFIPLLLQF